MLSISVSAAVGPSTPDRLHWQGRELELGELLGSGTFSSVIAVKPQEGVGDMVAKLIHTAALSDYDRQRVGEEVRLPARHILPSSHPQAN